MFCSASDFRRVIHVNFQDNLRCSWFNPPLVWDGPLCKCGSMCERQDPPSSCFLEESLTLETRKTRKWCAHRKLTEVWGIRPRHYGKETICLYDIFRDTCSRTLKDSEGSLCHTFSCHQAAYCFSHLTGQELWDMILHAFAQACTMTKFLKNPLYLSVHSSEIFMTDSDWW